MKKLPRPTWKQFAISILIAGLGLLAGRALSQVNQDIMLMYSEYTLGATEVAHISADVIRYRVTIIRSLEAQTRQDFERIIAPLAEQRAAIQHAVDRYAAASLRVSRSGRSEADDLRAVKDSLDAYFQAASKTISLMTQAWVVGTPKEAAALRRQAELHAADNAGPKLVQISLALDRLVDTIADVAKDMRNDGTAELRATSSLLVFGSLFVAIVNLFSGRAAAPSPEPRPADIPTLDGDNGPAKVHPSRRQETYADPALRRG